MLEDHCVDQERCFSFANPFEHEGEDLVNEAVVFRTTFSVPANDAYIAPWMEDRLNELAIGQKERHLMRLV